MSKGPSPLRQKMAAWRAQPYTPAQRMAYQACECDSGAKPPPPWVRDRAADLALSGGYNTRKTCPTHFIALSVNGTCVSCLGD